jgi:hypothetical protein
VRAEHENELTVLVGREQAIREHETRERERGRDRARFFTVCSGLAMAMPVAKADTYETRDIIGNHRSRATTPF